MTSKKTDTNPPDREMVQNLDVLLMMDVLETEQDWQDIGDLENVGNDELKPDDSNGGSNGK